MTRDRHLFRLFGGYALTGASLLVFGWATANAQSAVVMPTNVPGIGIVLPPPAGFDPVTASAAERAQYAVPPAPDPNIAPQAYAKWLQMMSGLRNREAPVLVEQTNIYNGPVQKVGKPVIHPNGIITTTSDNWSGTAVVGSALKTELAIIGEFVVPEAHQAFGSCTGSYDYSSQWPGIDGYNSNDVLQAGTEADAYCLNSSTSSFYSAWIEWYPNAETRVSSPAITPGDLVGIEVWNTSLTQGMAYFYDYSTEVSAEYSLTAPAGTSLQGNSAEWIVERPGINHGLATLTNYIDVAWPSGYAWNYNAASPTYVYDGQSPPSPFNLYVITMLDNNGNGISAATLENGDFLFFQDFGSACGRSGGFPPGPVPPC